MHHTITALVAIIAAAKSAKLFDEAIELANRTPCSPQTLTRAVVTVRLAGADFHR